MWIQTQKGDEILEVDHIKLLPLDDGTVNILAKLDRETVLLGNYGKKQTESIVEDLKWEANRKASVYEMPESEEEKK